VQVGQIADDGGLEPWQEWHPAILFVFAFVNVNVGVVNVLQTERDTLVDA